LIRATAIPKRRAKNEEMTSNDHSAHFQLHKFLPLWALYADLEESLGTIDTAKSVYDRMIDLRIVTPQIILNYARFLQDHQLYEDTFKVRHHEVQ
jgi:pre-mRNA-splicing factor SYF1